MSELENESQTDANEHLSALRSTPSNLDDAPAEGSPPRRQSNAQEQVRYSVAKEARSPSGKKIFLAVFFAVLAAAAVISGGLAAKSRLDKWNQAKKACLDEMYSMSEALGDVSGEIKGADTYAELTVALRNMNKANKRIDDAERLLVSLLENKPFGLPLTKDEKEWLRVCAKPAKESDLTKATLTPSQVPRWATLVQEVPIRTPSGQFIALPIGTRLELVSQEGSKIRIRYAGTEYIIPADLAVIQ